MPIIDYGDPAADTVLIQPVDAHDLAFPDREFAMIRDSFHKPLRLLAFQVGDWNRALSPWEAPPVFGKEGFGGDAAKTLADILPYCTDTSKTYYLGGYSLAGLFALWAASQTEVFSGIAAASPSVWFPRFTDYLQSHPLKAGSVYLSLGDKEEKTRNPLMSTVGSGIRSAFALIKAQGIPCTLEWNPGNHFKDAELRCAKAFIWVLEQRGSNSEI